MAQGNRVTARVTEAAGTNLEVSEHELRAPAAPQGHRRASTVRQRLVQIRKRSLRGAQSSVDGSLA